MTKLKEALLSFDGVIDNEYLDQYIALVSNSFSFFGNDYTEKHHVIPVAFYKMTYNCRSREEAEYKFADKDANNFKVKLLFKDHCKAHWLLFNCTTDTLKNACAVAFIRMIRNEAKLANGLTDAEYEELQQYRNQVRQDSTLYWSAEEDQWLIDNYSIKTIDECVEQLGRSTRSIQDRATSLGVTNLNYRECWSAEEIKWLTANYNKFTKEELSQYLNRPLDGVRSKLIRLGLGADPHKQFTMEEDSWLLKHFGIDYGAKESAQYLGRDVGIVCDHAKILGIGGRAKELYYSKKLERDTKCKTWLLENYTNFTGFECAKQLGISKSLLYTYAKDLNLKFKPRSEPNKPIKYVKCLNTGEVFPGVKAVMAEFHISHRKIHKALDEHTVVTLIDGRQFEFKYI